MSMGQASSCINNTAQKEEFSIPLWQYDEAKHKWSEKKQDQNKCTNHWEDFRVVTYNIWFSNEFQSMRFNSLCDILDKSQAQVIGLQEMTQNILKQLLQQPFIQNRYYLSNIDGRTFSGWYGVVLLIDTRLHVSNLNLIDFPQSGMGRRLVFAEIQLDKDEILRVGTVHLESLSSQKERSRQLDICQRVLNHSSGSSILMGDFNFGAHGRENIEKFNKLSQWIDVWAHLMDSNNYGYTFDTEVNSMIKIHSKTPEQARYDRIILLSQTIIPTQIEIIGMQPIGKFEQYNIFPSDHFGLTAVFQNKK